MSPTLISNAVVMRHIEEPAFDIPKDQTPAAKLIDEVPVSNGIMQKVKVYSIKTKNGIVQIIGSIGGRIVIIKATIYELGIGTSDKVRRVSLKSRAKIAAIAQEVGNTLKTRTIFLQDGVAYITSAVGGRLVYVKAKVVEPIKSCALSLYGSSRERMDAALQTLKPYYVKVEQGIAGIVGTIGNKYVVIKVKTHERYASMQAWTLDSFEGARTVLDGFTAPLLNRATSLRQSSAAKVDHILVTIKNGVVHVNGVVRERILNLQTTLSETAICRQMSKGWRGTTELIGKLSELVSNAGGRGRDKLKIMYVSMKDRVLYITCWANDRFVIVRVKVGDIAEHIRSRSLELYAKTRASLYDVCLEVETTVVKATEVMRIKASHTGTNVRSLVANRDAQAAAAGAVAVGTSAGVTGLLAGGVVGAACALPAAFFTFGLSIPVGAAVGAGGGLCIGGSAGIVAGGMGGYKAHREKESIRKSISGAFMRAKERKDKAVDSASNLRSCLVERIAGTAVA